MDGEESREELNCKIRRNLCDLFGPFDEFTERLSRGVKHGLIRSKMKSRSSPFVSLHMTHESPSHIPVQVALQSMRNLVEKPLSALPMDFPGGLIAAKGVETSGDRSGKNGKRRKMSEDEGVAMKRKKDQKNAKSAVREKEDAFSPDSGVHSTENDIDESSTVETMLSIMTSLEEPRLSPIPINFKDLERGKKEEKSKKNEPKNSKFPTGSSTSSATTSRESSPGSTKRKDAAARQSLSKECVTGQIKLKNLKPEKVKKLLDLAKKLGKLIEENKEEKREREKTPPEKEKEPKKHRTIQMLTRDAPKLSPAAAAPSPRSAINTPTPSILSRPSSSLSTHEANQGGTPKASTHEKSSARNPQAVKQPTRWTCQWEHTKLETIQRVPLPDPADHKFKSIGEFYHALAKDWKSQADKSKDRVVRPLNYILSSVYFLMEAIKKVEKERTPKAMMTCASIYRDTYELLGVAVFQGIRETDDAFAAHILPRIKILGQIMLSVMQYQMYLFRSEQAMKTFSRLERREVTECIEVRSVPSHSQSDCTPSLPNKLINTVVA
uniref:AF4/FMR2 family member lilli n=1 Tax=Caenorhabditis japonica TaxID=281687 RepID=A0A8R1E1T5_CAEJA